MIECNYGTVKMKGDNLRIISEYICITNSMVDVLCSTLKTNQITPEEKLACELMSVMGVAFDGSKLSNRKAFYEVIEMIAKREKGWTV